MKGRIKQSHKETEIKECNFTMAIDHDDGKKQVYRACEVRTWNGVLWYLHFMADRLTF